MVIIHLPNVPMERANHHQFDKATNQLSRRDNSIKSLKNIIALYANNRLVNPCTVSLEVLNLHDFCSYKQKNIHELGLHKRR